MIKQLLHTLALLLFLASAPAVYAQVNFHAKTDRNKILIGEPVKLTLEAYVPLGTSLQWPSIDTIPHFEITDKSVLDTLENIDGKKLTQQLTITGYDSGRWVLPSFPVKVDSQFYYTDTLAITVSFIPFDPEEDYRDIKEIIDVESGSSGYIPWILAAMILVILLLVYLYLRRNKPVKPVPVAVAETLSPFEEAMRALDALQKPSGEAGELKAYYTRMNEILGRFVSRKFGISTNERTNGELILQLRAVGLDEARFNTLAQTLRVVDFVKFAKYSPGEDDNQTHYETIRTSIRILDNLPVSAV